MPDPQYTLQYTGDKVAEAIQKALDLQSFDPTATETVVKRYPGVPSKLVTASITGVSSDTTSASAVSGGTSKDIAKAGTPVRYGTANVGTAKTVATISNETSTIGNANVGEALTITGVQSTTTKASLASADTAKDVAKAGTAVVYGKANVGTAVTSIAKVGNQITYGNANVGEAVSVVTGLSSTAYHANYNEVDACLELSPLTITTTAVTPATTSSTKAYVCADGTGVSITPAVSAPDTQTIIPAVSNGKITPYTFTDVAVPIKATASTVFNPATNSSATIKTFLGTTSIAPAVEAGETQTVTPAVSNGTLTGSYTIKSVTVPIKASSATTVATGQLSTAASGAGVLTGLGNPETVAVVKPMD